MISDLVTFLEKNNKDFKVVLIENRTDLAEKFLDDSAGAVVYLLHSDLDGDSFSYEEINGFSGCGKEVFETASLKIIVQSECCDSELKDGFLSQLLSKKTISVSSASLDSESIYKNELGRDKYPGIMNYLKINFTYRYVFNKVGFDCCCD